MPSCLALIPTGRLVPALAALLGASVAAGGSATPPPSVELHELSEGTSWTAHNCEVLATADGFTIRAISPQPVVERPLDVDEGATVVEFEASSRLPAGDHYVAWSVAGDEGWRNFVRIPMTLDGSWCRYRLPLNAEGRLAGIRFAFNTTQGEVGLRSIRVRQLPADPGPSAPIAKTSVYRGHLTLAFNPESRRLTIDDARTGRQWRSTPLTRWARIDSIRSPAENAIHLMVTNRFTNRSLCLEATLEQNGSVRLAMIPSNKDDLIEGLEDLIPRFESDIADGSIVFCDRSCGVRLEQRDATYGKWPLRVYGNTHCLDMPWIGVYDAGSGDGMLTLFETPADAEVDLRPDAEGRHWPQPRWLPTKDRFGYARAVTLHLTTQGGYVALAKTYRDLLKSSGRLVGLTKKAEKRPDVSRLAGAAIIWTNDQNFEALREAYALGARRAVVSNCRAPSNVEWLKSRGMLVGRYDSYSDIFEGGLGFQRDNIERSAVRGRPGATPMDGWTMADGRQMAWRSTALWKRAATSYVPEQLQKSGHNARFIDVAVASKLDEDWSPDHSYDRRGDLELRRDLLKYLASFGLVLGTEHGNDWAADIVDYHEGSLSGPFWWSSWEAGHLKPPRADQLSPEYLKFGMGCAGRVPLWQLVYQDCLVSTWYWGDTAGMLYHASPALADRKDLFTMLYGGTPLLWLAEPDKGYGWDVNRWRWLRTYHDTTRFHRHVAFAEMTRHEFVDHDGALQRTHFANGATALVNFGDEPMVDPADRSAVLAPQGYRLTAAEFRQERLWTEGQAVTAIEEPGFLLLDAQAEHSSSGVTHTGRVTLFASDDNTWTFVGEPNASCKVDVARITGWATTTKYQISAVGPGGPLASDAHRVATELLVIPSANLGWAYKLTPVAAASPVGSLSSDFKP